MAELTSPCLQFKDSTTQYLAYRVKCHIMRPHGKYHPDGPIRVERLEVTVAAPGSTNTSLLNWYVERTALDGFIFIPMPTAQAPTMEIKFEGGVCFRMVEDYNVDSPEQRFLTLSFEATKVTIQEKSASANQGQTAAAS